MIAHNYYGIIIIDYMMLDIRYYSQFIIIIRKM
jgi:hypothetical protein